MIREPVAIASWIAVAAVSVAPSAVRPRSSVLDLALTAATFFASAAATRYWLQETRTREQILAFATAAALLPVARRIASDGGPSSGTAIVANAGCAALGAMLVRLKLEGLPF